MLFKNSTVVLWVGLLGFRGFSLGRGVGLVFIRTLPPVFQRNVVLISFHS